jgi:hypothetical protein
VGVVLFIGGLASTARKEDQATPERPARNSQYAEPDDLHVYLMPRTTIHLARRIGVTFRLQRDLPNEADVASHGTS